MAESGLNLPVGDLLDAVAAAQKQVTLWERQSRQTLQGKSAYVLRCMVLIRSGALPIRWLRFAQEAYISLT
eukprot:scaffold190761_cov50-Prasinocladus_malaysianus.AAC.1